MDVTLMSVGRYLARHPEVDAVRWDGSNVGDVMDLMPSGGLGNGRVFIHTPTGVEVVEQGDWIIRTAGGAFLRCDHETFDRTYGRVI